MIDSDFGECKKGVKSWICQLEANEDFFPVQNIRTHLRLESDHPSDEQRQIFCEFKTRFSKLWPVLSRKLLELNREIASYDELLEKIQPAISISIPGIIGDERYDLTIIFEFKNDPDRKGYFLSFSSWKIESAVVAE